MKIMYDDTHLLIMLHLVALSAGLTLASSVAQR